jgi:hypothetical protein
MLPALVAQTGSGDRSVTVTASRNNSVTPDQGVFAVTALSPTDASREDVLAVVQEAGLTINNFDSIYTTTTGGSGPGQPPRDSLQWTFSLTVPLTSLKATVAQLTALQQSVAQKKNGMTVSFSLRSTQASAQALAAQPCAASDLIADARAQAQKMASAAGAGLGGILAISGSSTVTPPGQTLFASAITVPTCSLTVKFALTGF